jgi:hypothetical protein
MSGATVSKPLARFEKVAFDSVEKVVRVLAGEGFEWRSGRF